MTNFNFLKIMGKKSICAVTLYTPVSPLYTNCTMHIISVPEYIFTLLNPVGIWAVDNKNKSVNLKKNLNKDENICNYFFVFFGLFLLFIFKDGPIGDPAETYRRTYGERHPWSENNMKDILVFHGSPIIIILWCTNF